jgi:hypothetical protein
LALISGLLEEPAWTPGPKLEEPAGLALIALLIPASAGERQGDHLLQERSSVGAEPEKWAGPASGRVGGRPFQAQKEVV